MVHKKHREINPNNLGYIIITDTSLFMGRGRNITVRHNSDEAPCFRLCTILDRPSRNPLNN